MAGFVKDSQKTLTRPDTERPLVVNSFEWGVLAVALLLRIGVVLVLFGNLSDDRDAYLGIAKSIVDGHGYCSPGSDTPTAFRPPLYPLMISAVSPLGTQLGLAIAHVLLGTFTVWLTMRLGRLLNVGHYSWLAGAVVAVNPLLLHYTSFPMTETLFTFLVVAWLNTVFGSNRHHPIVAGILFGLAALCRPTILAVAPLIGLWLFATKRRVAGVERSSPPEPQISGGSLHSTPATQTSRVVVKKHLITIAIVVLMLAPWTIRNQLVFGKPIFATSHGGYTLLLGNNPVFYKNVVRKPWGTTWGDLEGVYEVDEIRTQSSWLHSLNGEMIAEGITGEVARDNWMYRRAFKNIKDDPTGFVRACLLRFGRFWNVMPMGPEAKSKPAIVIWSVGAFYFAVLLTAFVSLIRVIKSRDSRWAIPLLFCLALTIVHLFYWSNLRMRAPLEPILALLAIRGIFGQTRDCKDDKT